VDRLAKGTINEWTTAKQVGWHVEGTFAGEGEADLGRADVGAVFAE
jgi:hypothetical protein